MGRLVSLDKRPHVVGRVPAEILAGAFAFGLGVADGVVVHRLGRGQGQVQLGCQRQVDDPQDGPQGQDCRVHSQKSHGLNKLIN